MEDGMKKQRAERQKAKMLEEVRRAESMLEIHEEDLINQEAWLGGQKLRVETWPDWEFREAYIRRCEISVQLIRADVELGRMAQRKLESAFTFRRYERTGADEPDDW